MKSLAEFSADLRRLPRVVAQQVAKEAAPELTKLAAKTFEASEDPYGVPWKPSDVTGAAVTLRRTGNLFRFIKYVAIGTKLRIALGTSYAKYQIGRRHVFPTQHGHLPEEYVRALKRTAVAVCKRELFGR